MLPVTVSGESLGGEVENIFKGNKVKPGAKWQERRGEVASNELWRAVRKMLLRWDFCRCSLYFGQG